MNMCFSLYSLGGDHLGHITHTIPILKPSDLGRPFS
jgi:hypothetical protein